MTQPTILAKPALVASVKKLVVSALEVDPYMSEIVVLSWLAMFAANRSPARETLCVRLTLICWPADALRTLS